MMKDEQVIRLLKLLNRRVVTHGVQFVWQSDGSIVIHSPEWKHLSGMKWKSLNAAFIEDEAEANDSVSAIRYFIVTYNVLAKAGKQNEAKRYTFELFRPMSELLKPLDSCKSLEELLMKLEVLELA